ncbi:carbohydrate ABC transporter permease [Streptomyces phyllanthi]|uniref:Sugar ABC transporter permease n=1 Tax=Streptomyces phyllanthi TaxID=1803180 RepID=A0A5N8WH20_9ACTN|nr:sugar ABC transporter permease [Streptomyces phyllanthi]MPY46527.1 sugar ABC transporter permease [Streptomyces phyllanthi]
MTAAATGPSAARGPSSATGDPTRSDPGPPPPRPGSAPSARRVRLRRAALPWLFLSPALLLFLYFKYLPMAKGINLSFYKVQPFLGDQWVGLDNYTRILDEESFRRAFGHTVVYAVAQTAGAMLLGFVLALLLEGRARTLWFVRSAAFLPVVAAVAVVAEVWRLLYFPGQEGMLNSLLSWFGSDAQRFLDDPDQALGWVIVVGIWKNAPYDMMIVLAGLASIDRQLYESAALDGAGLVRRLRHVTLPALRPVVTILLTLAAIRGMRVFTEVYILTGGGPAGSTDVLMTRIYDLGFRANDLGFASACSVVLFLLTLVLTGGVTWYRRRKELS